VFFHGSGAKKQEAFFDAVYSGDPAKVLALCDPRLTEEVDAPMLATWMRIFAEQHGEYQGLSKSNFSASKKIENGIGVLEIEGTVNFANGPATSKLVLHDDKIVNFNVESEKVLANWAGKPDDTTLYRQRGEEMITHLLTGQHAKAHTMLVQGTGTTSLTEMESISARAAERLGKLTSITATADEFQQTPEGAFLEVTYDVICSRGKADGTGVFQMSNLKGHLIRFGLTPR